MKQPALTLALAVILATSFVTSTQASEDQGGLPKCEAEVRDDMNTTINTLNWREDLFLGAIKGATQPIRISTSLGNNKIMSLWVREDKEPNPNGMFSFVDLSTGRPQYFRFYMADGYSVQVTCTWDPN